MKKIKIISLLFLMFLVTGCSKITKFEKISPINNDFHQIKVAEKINNGILYYDGDKVIYETTEKREIAKNVSSLWRENNDVYYVSDNKLFIYNVENQKTKKLVDKPHKILGKYKDSIISYNGRTIYSINNSKKTKLFKDGYYLNRAILYKNRVYGIPATNIYEYELDTLSVSKVTNNSKVSSMNLINNELWITEKNKNNYVYSKVVDNNMKKVFTLKNIENASNELDTKNGMIIKTSKLFDESTKDNKLLYISDGKIKTIDKNYDYNVIGTYNSELCYYKNIYANGTEQKNLKTFYLYNGKRNKKAFDIDVGYYEDIKGYEYDNGLLIEIIYESNTRLYNYNGKNIKRIEESDNIYRITGIDIVENKAYVKYTDGEESFSNLGKIINLS